MCKEMQIVYVNKMCLSGLPLVEPRWSIILGDYDDNISGSLE